MDDLIKREDATETFAELYDVFDDYPNIIKELHKRYDKMLAIPSVELKRERCEYCKDGDFIGQRIMLGNDGKWHEILFCPNCGCRMKGADNETD